MLASITSSTKANFNSPSFTGIRRGTTGGTFIRTNLDFIAQRRSGERVFRIAFDRETDVETEVRDVRKRASRIDSLRSQHQEDVLHEVLGQAALLVFGKRFVTAR